jgi:hypothetical protein
MRMPNLKKLSPFRHCSIFRRLCTASPFFEQNSQKDDRYGHWQRKGQLPVVARKKMKMTLASFIHQLQYFTYLGRYLINLSRRPPTRLEQRQYHVESTRTNPLIVVNEQLNSIWRNLNNLPWR